jgi:hypothetical protein
MTDVVKMLLNISPKLADKLEKMSEESHSSKSDVLHKAIYLMDIAIDSKKQGNKIAIVNKEGKLINGILGI